MHTIQIEKTVNASSAEVWETWDDFGNIDRFNPLIRASRILSSSPRESGLGARRECEFSDGRNWVREQITAYEPGESMSIEVYESNLPLRTMRATIRMARVSRRQTRVTITATFEARVPVLGKLLGPLMAPRFRKQLTLLLEHNAAFIENKRVTSQAA